MGYLMKHCKIAAFWAFFCLLVALSAGCSPRGEGRVDSVRILRGTGQTALPGERFPVELVLELTDSDYYGRSGGSGRKEKACRE